jgi:hypothetical protein
MAAEVSLFFQERTGHKKNKISCLHLLAAVDQTLLRRWDAFLLFDTLLYALDLWINLKLAFRL